MPLDTRIALGVQPIQLESPVNHLSQALQIQNALRQNQMGQMEIQEYQRKRQQDEELRNYLTQIQNISSPDSRTGLLKFGAGGAAIAKSLVEQDKIKADLRKSEIDQKKELLNIYKSTLGGLVANPDPNLALAKLQQFAQISGQDMSEEIAIINSMGGDSMKLRQWAAGESIAAEKLLPQFEKIDLGGSVQQQTIDPVTGKVISANSTKKTMTPGEGARLAQAERHFGISQANQNRAPSLTEVVDPNNPTQMLRVDAKRYKGGTEGVIGVSGKEPKAQATAEKTDAGKRQLQDTIDGIRNTYAELRRGGGISSTKGSIASNVGAAIGSSGVGQIAGRVLGTDNQSKRDIIKSSRLQLLNAVKEATGMSSKSLDSNAELKTWLDSLSDPSQSIETVNQILDNLENKYVKGGSKVPASSNGKDMSDDELLKALGLQNG